MTDQIVKIVGHADMTIEVIPEPGAEQLADFVAKSINRDSALAKSVLAKSARDPYQPNPYSKPNPVKPTSPVKKSASRDDHPVPGTVGASMGVGRENLMKSAELETQAYKWEQLIAKNTYGMPADLKGFYRDKIKEARREAAKLRGEPVAEPEPEQVVSKSVTFTLPR